MESRTSEENWREAEHAELKQFRVREGRAFIDPPSFRVMALCAHGYVMREGE